jgi:hypothetical protein
MAATVAAEPSPEALMSRTPSLIIPALLVLCGCDQPSMNQYAERDVATAEAPAEPPMVDGIVRPRFSAGTAGGAPAAELQPQSGESYVYDHNLTVSMASEHIKARFERARDRCQNDPALKCKITAASFRLVGEPDAPLPIANLSVALPHDAMAPFEEGLLALLPGESKDDVVVRARNTNAQNVTNQVRDIDARLAQLSNYRDRMMELSKRGGAKTDDLIKIEGEISRTQSEIEQIEGQRRDLADRIAKENLSISFEAQSTASDAFQPVRDVWQESLRIMGSSAATALGLIVAIIPWIPVFLGVYFLVRWLWRRRKKAQA